MVKNGKTVGQYLDYWIEIVVRGNVRYSTYTSYKGYINNHIKRLMGDFILSELKPLNIQEFVGKLVIEKKLSARTIGIIVRMMSCALSCAEDYELIAKNPCCKIRTPKIDEEEVKVFDNSAQTKIEKAILKSNDYRCYGILFTLYTGLRIGELCVLRWENIDFGGKIAYIKKSLGRFASKEGSGKKTEIRECDPKTKKSKRIIHLPDFIVKILKKLKAESKSEFVFSMKNGNFIQPRTMQLIYKKLLASANVSYIKFHSLRHTFATRAAENNIDPKTISETLGHSNTTITLNRYTHSLKEQKQKMVRQLNAYFNNKKITWLSQ